MIKGFYFYAHLLGYRLGIFFYKTIVALMSPFNVKAQKAIYQRKKSIKQLYQQLADDESAIVWLHSSSLGEFEQGLPVMEACKAHYPNIKLLVTFFSPSGYELRKDHNIADYTAYLPWDSPSNAKAFIKKLNLKAVFLSSMNTGTTI